MDNFRQKPIQKEKALDSRPSTLGQSLFLVFTLAEFFEHGEARVFRARNVAAFERIERGKDFAHRLAARRTICERLGRERTVQREFSAADLAAAFAQFIFVKRHGMNFDFQLLNVELKLITFDDDECN
jgi:hypothetical protein